MPPSNSGITFTSENGVLKINQQRLKIKGASWFGFETSSHIPHGIWSVDYKSIIDFMATNKFNAVRLPFSLELVMNNPAPTSINFGSCALRTNCNAELKDLKAL